MEYLDFVLAGNPVPVVEREASVARAAQGHSSDASTFKEPLPRPNISVRSVKLPKPEGSRSDVATQGPRPVVDGAKTSTETGKARTEEVRNSPGFRIVAGGTRSPTDHGRTVIESTRVTAASTTNASPASTVTAQDQGSDTRDICQFINNARRYRSGVLARSASTVFPRGRVIPAPSLHTTQHIGGVRRMSVTSTATSTTIRMTSSTATNTTPIITSNAATNISTERGNPVFGSLFSPQWSSQQMPQQPQSQGSQQPPSSQPSSDASKNPATSHTMSIINKLYASSKPAWSLKQEVGDSVLDLTQKSAPPKAISAHRKQKLKRLLRLS